MTSECENAADNPRSTACPIVPRTATMNAAIIVFECPGSNPCNAPSNTAVGRKNHACAAPLERSWEKSVMQR